MSTETQTLTDLKDLRAAGPGAEVAAEAREPQIDPQGRAYATGRRKNAVARVWIKPGNGKVTVNGREGADLFRPPRAADDDRPALRRDQPSRPV